MRRRLSYANVAATLALVFFMSGGALAASHYLINSTKQISPKVLKKLKGNTGPAGPARAAGATAKEGATGPPGKEGPKGEQGPSHAYSAEGTGSASVTVPAGSYAVSGAGEFVNSSTTKYGAGECGIETPGNPSGDVRYASVPNIGEEEGREHEVYGETSISNHVTAALNAPGKITEACKTGLESQVAVSTSRAEVVAIQVGAVN